MRTARNKPCARCRLIRTVLLSGLLGGGAGYAVLRLGGSDELSMLATFGGALGPVLWYARQNRIDRAGTE